MKTRNTTWLVASMLIASVGSLAAQGELVLSEFNNSGFDWTFDDFTAVPGPTSVRVYDFNDGWGGAGVNRNLNLSDYANGRMVVDMSVNSSNRVDRFELELLDIHGNIKLANRAAEHQLKRTQDELLGCELSSMVVPEERDRIQQFLRIEGLCGTGDTGQTETFAVRSDGIRYPVELRANSTGDEQGKLVCVTLSDLSVRYEAEREMRQALAMLDSTEDAAFIVDPDTLKFTYVNQAATEQIGYSKQELVSRMGPADIIPKMTEKKLRSDLNKLERYDGKRIDFDTIHLHQDGSKIPIRTTIRFFELPNDQTCFVA